jgi:hypothetical protein
MLARSGGSVGDELPLKLTGWFSVEPTAAERLKRSSSLWASKSKVAPSILDSP